MSMVIFILFSFLLMDREIQNRTSNCVQCRHHFIDMTYGFPHTYIQTYTRGFLLISQYPDCIEPHTRYTAYTSNTWSCRCTYFAHRYTADLTN